MRTQPPALEKEGRNDPGAAAGTSQATGKTLGLVFLPLVGPLGHAAGPERVWACPQGCWERTGAASLGLGHEENMGLVGACPSPSPSPTDCLYPHLMLPSI